MLWFDSSKCVVEGTNGKYQKRIVLICFFNGLESS